MIKFYELAPSPNNLKVRMALKFKRLAFEVDPVDYVDRSNVLEASGQELTPVIEDRGIVLNDSEGILQYLDANYVETPRLFPRTRAARRECDAWKYRLDETVAVHWLPVFLHGIGRRDKLDEKARSAFLQALARLDREIGNRESFKDDAEMSICDLRVAEWAVYALPGAGLVQRVPLFRRFREHYAADPKQLRNLERFLRPWNDRLA